MNGISERQWLSASSHVDAVRSIELLMEDSTGDLGWLSGRSMELEVADDGSFCCRFVRTFPSIVSICLRFDDISFSYSACRRTLLAISISSSVALFEWMQFFTSLI